jgi:hypothetical protein
MVIIMNEYNENGRNTSNDDYGDRKPVCDRQIVLNAASGGAGPLPLITTLLASPINVVSAAIDTTGMGNTNNLLTFTGTINLPLGISVTLNFRFNV